MSGIKIIFKVYVFAVSIFMLLRTLLFVAKRHEIINDPVTGMNDIFSAVIWSIRYDLLISGFILILPFILLSIYDFRPFSKLKSVAFWWIFILFSISFILTASNIPYYIKFFQPLTLKAFQWFDDPAVVFGMVIQEPKFWFPVIPAVVIMYIFYLFLKRIFQNQNDTSLPFVKKVAYHFLWLLLMFITIRGTVAGAPLRVQDAFRHHNNLLNDLKLNPVFVFEKSIEDYFKNHSGDTHFMPDSVAIAITQKYLNVKQPVNENPISRQVNFDSLPDKKNVIVVLMESMAAWKMAYFGNKEQRTPFLDSLFRQSIGFANMYSNGIHTYAGIYGVNFAYPEIFDLHPFKTAQIKQYYGLPQILKDYDYQTAFFIPHNKDFDNLGRFLISNAYDHIYFEKDYPQDSIRNIWGVDDHFLLNFALKKIDNLYKNNRPFLATVLTISDHAPYYIPPWIKGKNEDIRATRFADWSLKDFMKKAAKKPWFDQTVFVFVADHGEGHDRIYDIPLTYNHIPALIYYKDVQPKIISKISAQMDLYPGLMHVLHMNYLNTGFGMDFFSEHRSYVLFNHDKKYGVVDHDFLLIFDREKIYGLYKYRQKDRNNYSKTYPEITNKMLQYGQAQIQTAQYILNHDWQKLH